MEAFDQPAVPRAHRTRAFGKESAGRRQDARAGFQLLAASLTLVLPIGDPEVPLPQRRQTLPQTPGALGDQRGHRREAGLPAGAPACAGTADRAQAGAGARRALRGPLPATRPTVQRPFAQPRQPAPQRRVRRCVFAHRPHRAAQPGPLRIGIDVAAAEPLDDRQGKALEGQQFAGQHPHPSPTAPATGQNHRPHLRHQGAAFALLHNDTALNPTARKNQGADRLALRTKNLIPDALAFDSDGAQFIIGDGNGDRYESGIGVSVSGGAGVAAPAPPHK